MADAAGGIVATAAVIASVGARPLLRFINEGTLPRVGQVAMIVSGVAMLTLSGTKVANAHDAWVAYVTPDGESELRLFWDGTQRFAAEIEPEGYIVLE